jgi:glyoxylate/hydroxypyruvate reductase A
VREDSFRLADRESRGLAAAPAQALPQDELVAVPDKSVEIALIATPPAGTFQKLGRPRLVQSLWMGVEKLLADPTYPRGVPLARLVDPGMVARCRRP